MGGLMGFTDELWDGISGIYDAILAQGGVPASRRSVRGSGSASVNAFA
jgi:hypothetical protein